VHGPSPEINPPIRTASAWKMEVEKGSDSGGEAAGGSGAAMLVGACRRKRWGRDGPWRGKPK